MGSLVKESPVSYKMPFLLNAKRIIFTSTITGHLGNVRLSYTDANKGGIIQPRKYQAMKCIGSPAGNVCYIDWKLEEIVEMNDWS
ncbi:hypothetical protein [Chryseobacterium sp. 2987]|uniref:hypothetical protein n=1 Tax=Chryseobacterium sp. 2987 TaxID=2817767 RepID=UPI0028626D3A|nr:hypothetical protein [Chryseobacterium sp. 2987]MDR6922273.1 hypothetical protein [Chryseobacterium sp. 2987]